MSIARSTLYLNKIRKYDPMSWKDYHKDPHRKREQKKYKNPIPSREFIIQWLEKTGSPVRYQDLIKQLKLKSKDEEEALLFRLKAMERDGQIIRNRRGSYGVVKKMNLVKGTIIAHPDGFGFLKPEDDSHDDFFIAPREMRKVLHDDLVLAHIHTDKRTKKKEASIVEILEHNLTKVVGRYHHESGLGLVLPNNKKILHDIFIPRQDSMDAEPGQIVVAEITQYPGKRRRTFGKVISLLGDKREPGIETHMAIHSFGIPDEWSGSIKKECKTLEKNDAQSKVEKHRADLTDKCFVTIDGEDAKDFDDALCCEVSEDKKTWTLYVAIADVSHYVTPDSELDKEALKRGNSTYFPDRVVPMLPEILSNELCSLKPKVDRNTLVCKIELNHKGQVKNYAFMTGLIHSKARLTYTQVNQYLDDGTAIQSKLVRQNIDLLFQLFEQLIAQRAERGALDFDLTESKIIMDEHKKIADIHPLRRGISERIVEECMLLANTCAAKFLKTNKIPCLYRVHEAPDENTVDDLKEFLNEMGLRFTGRSKAKPKHFQSLIETADGSGKEHLVQKLLLRSMMQAVYSPKAKGHFGLAYPIYTHFTSPIRRYPDLLVHRAIKLLIKASPKKHYEYTRKKLEHMGEHCSMTERRSEEATREVMYSLKCEYMMDKVGEEHDGIISGVTAFGLFVELNDLFIDGLVHVSTLNNDYYQFDSKRHRLTGERSKQQFHLGDTVRVKVKHIDIDEKEIDFELIES